MEHFGERIATCEDLYIDRIKNFNREREIFTNCVFIIKPNHRELHVLEWENRQQDESTSYLQKELEGVDAELRKIRKETDEARQELEDLLNSQESRKAQIRRFMELPQPVQRDITYLFFDKYAAVNPKKSQQQVTEIKEIDLGDLSNPGTLSKITGLPKRVRTGEIQLMEMRLKDEVGKAYSNIEVLKSRVQHAVDVVGKSSIESDSSLDTMRKNAETLIEDVDRLDHQCYMAVAELLKLRLRIMIAQREEFEGIEKLAREKKDFETKEASTRNLLMADMQKLKQQMKVDLKERTADFNKQLSLLMKRVEKLQKKDANEIVMEIAEAKQTENIEKKLIREGQIAKERYEKLRTRNALEMEGYHNEAQMLQKRLAHISKLYTQRRRQQTQGAHAYTGNATTKPFLADDDEEEEAHEQERTRERAHTRESHQNNSYNHHHSGGGRAAGVKGGSGSTHSSPSSVTQGTF